MRFSQLFFIASVLLLSNFVEGSNYYFSSSIGDDSRTSAQAQNPATPWKSINKLNSYFTNLSAGDSVLFNKSDVFVGTISPTKSGTPSSPIIISSYGSGNKPIISGFQTLTAWTSEGSGIYSKAITVQSTPNIVTVNGVNTPLGRYPKTTYLSILSHSGYTSITNAATNSSETNWTGAELVIRKDNWIWDRCPITSHSGTIITYKSPNAIPAIDGFGFFIQNDLRCLTLLGDWAYKSGKIYMYFGSNNPDIYTVKVSTIDRLVNIVAKNYIDIEGLCLQGANSAGVYSTGTGNTIKSCDLTFIGDNGITAWSGSNSLTVDGCNISQCQNRGVYGIAASPTIKNCYIHDIAMIRGMGGNGTTTYTGISLVQSGVSNSVIEYNRIDNIGYNAIGFSGSNSIVRYNYITNYCNILYDGGAIYTGGSSYTGRKIYNNICINNSLTTAALGAYHSGVSIEGIYLDSSTSNIDVYNNTAAYNAMSGIVLHGSSNTNVHDNVCFDNYTTQLLLVRDSYVTAMANNHVTRNQFVTSKTTANVLDHENTANWTNDLSSFGKMDSNYYCCPLEKTTPFYTLLGNSMTRRTFAQWKTYSGKDENSLLIPFTTEFLFEFATSTVRTIKLTGIWETLANISVTDSITIQPYTSIILIKSADIIANRIPSIQNQNFQITENKPNGSVVGTIVATDPDAGQTLSYSILSGNTNGTFAINASTGVLTISNSAALNYEVSPYFTLAVNVQDNGTGNLSNQATIKVSLIDINEVPIIDNQAFSVAKNASEGTTVGTVIATDPDAGQTLIYSIISGNLNGAFVINDLTGELSVAHGTALNNDFTLVVKVKDNGAGYLSNQATITINILSTGIEVNEIKQKIKVYPNPVSDELIIDIEGITDNPRFEILNSIGQIIFEGNMSERTVVQTANFSSGIYLIKFDNGKTIDFKKIVKE